MRQGEDTLRHTDRADADVDADDSLQTITTPAPAVSTVTRVVLYHLLRVVQRHGLPPEQLLPGLTHPESMPAQLGEHVSAEVMLSAWSRALRRLKRPDLPLDVALEAQREPISQLSFLCRSSATLGIAFGRLLRFWPVVSGLSQWRMRQARLSSGELVAQLQLTPLLRSKRPEGLEPEEVAGLECQLVFELVDVALGLKGLLSRQADVRVSVPERLRPALQKSLLSLGFSCTPASLGYALELEAHWLEQPLLRADSALAHLLERQLDEQVARHGAEATALPWSDRVRELLASTLEDASVEGVAQQLGVSRRTLQRQLEKEHTSFRLLLEGVRQDRLTQLTGQVKGEELASSLGYSDARALRRARQRWRDGRV